jgi:hypothetical protein
MDDSKVDSRDDSKDDSDSKDDNMGETQPHPRHQIHHLSSYQCPFPLLESYKDKFDKRYILLPIQFS